MHAWQWVRKTYPGLLIFHVPSGEVRDVATAMKLKRMGVIPGVADFLCFKGPRRVALELKNATGRMSKAQQAFQRQWMQEGGEYYLIKDLPGFKMAVDAIALF